MFCPYCGNPCAETHKYCFRCGKPLPEPIEPEPAASTVIPEESITEQAAPAVETSEAAPELLTETSADNSPLAVYATTEPSAEERDPAEAIPPQTPKGRLWPPILALGLMVFIGLVAYFVFPRQSTQATSCFYVDNGVLYFDDSLYTGSDELTVPAAVDGMTVTAISENCFADCDRLTTIILPETVTVIGDKAFAGCDALRGIYFPEGVLSVGNGALAQCPALEAVYFPETLTEIGDGCLDDCGALQYILFDGTYAQWRELYDGTFRSGVELHTSDGTYYAQP